MRWLNGCDLIGAIGGFVQSIVRLRWMPLQQWEEWAQNWMLQQQWERSSMLRPLLLPLPQQLAHGELFLIELEHECCSPFGGVI
jgi:hypothetical protein